MNAKLEQIVTAVSELTLMETADLVKILEEKWGVSAAAPMAVAAPAAAAPVAEEKSEWTVVLKSAGEKKMGVIKALREVVPSLSLTDAKNLADSGGNVKENISKADAVALQKKLTDEGATVELI